MHGIMGGGTVKTAPYPIFINDFKLRITDAENKALPLSLA
jgi:hypothetical protein